MTADQLGKVAYEALHRAAVERETVDADEKGSVPWDALGEAQRDVWADVAQAVLEAAADENDRVPASGCAMEGVDADQA